MLCLMYAYVEFNEACPDFLAASLHFFGAGVAMLDCIID